MHLRQKQRSGQSLVEFALVLPILALFMVGTLDLARAFYIKITLANAVRVAAEAATNPVEYLRYANISTGQFNAEVPGVTDPCSGSYDVNSPCVKQRASLAIRYRAVKEANFIDLTLADVAINPDANFNSSNFTFAPNTKYTLAARATFVPITPIIANLWGGTNPLLRHEIQLRHGCTPTSGCGW